MAAKKTRKAAAPHKRAVRKKKASTKRKVKARTKPKARPAAAVLDNPMPFGAETLPPPFRPSQSPSMDWLGRGCAN